MFRIFENKNVNYSSWSVLSAYSFGQNLRKKNYITFYRNYLVIYNWISGSQPSC